MAQSTNNGTPLPGAPQYQAAEVTCGDATVAAITAMLIAAVSGCNGPGGRR